MRLQANAFTVISILLLAMLWSSQHNRVEVVVLGAVMIGLLIARAVGAYSDGGPTGAQEGPRRSDDSDEGPA